MDKEGLTQCTSNSTDGSECSRASNKNRQPLQQATLRQSNAEKSLSNKKKVVKMLFVVVVEFFVCWTPLYVINTLAFFDPGVVYRHIGYTGISFVQLLAYASSCCNPITYCFMNNNFRVAFLNVFGCGEKKNTKLAYMESVHVSMMRNSTSTVKSRSTASATRESVLTNYDQRI